MTSSSANEPVTSSARASAANFTSDCRSYGVCGSTSLAGLNFAAASPGVVPMLMPGLDLAGAVAVSFFFVVTSQPRVSTLPTCSAAVTEARSRRMSVPASRTNGLLSPGVLTAGAPEAGSGFTNWNFPFASTDITISFSSASRARKSQSVTLAWLMNSYTVFVDWIRPIGTPSWAASLRAMSEALWLR